MEKFHINQETGEVGKCTANIKICPVGGEHYSSLEEARAAYENAQNDELLTSAKRKPRNEFTQHIRNADKRIRDMEDDLKKRDERQGSNTIIQQLYRDGITEEDLQRVMDLKLNNRESGIGTLSSKDDDSDPVVGVTYTGDYRAEEEWGLKHIKENLEKGTLAKDNVVFMEKNGRGYLAIKGDQPYLFKETGPAALKKADERFTRYSSGDDWKEEIRLSKKSLIELKQMLKGKVKPLPTTKDKLINAAINLNRPKNYIKHPQGEFHDGTALAIVSDNPAMIATMKHIKEAHDDGALRLGESANPFSRGVLFYDERDISRKNKIGIVKDEEAKKASEEYIAEVEEKLKEKGRLYAASPNADRDTKDIRDSEYFLNYYPNKRDFKDVPANGVYGWFKKEDLQKIAGGDLTPFTKKED